MVEKKQFKHAFIHVPVVTATTTDSYRVYHTPDGTFPSVTTVLGRATDRSGLDAWRARVGEEEADKISGRATRRGSAVHDIAERYLRNDPDWNAGAMPFNALTFDPLRALLDRHIGDVWGIEFPLWSERLMTAGRTDLFCEWDGAPAIVDFKTAAKFQSENSPRVDKYLLQTATYAIMASESTKINTRKIVLLFCPDDSPHAIAIVRDRDEFASRVETIFNPRNREQLDLAAS